MQTNQEIYFIKDIENIIGRNRLTIRRWYEKGIFPKPTLISNNLAWRSSVIKEWIDKNIPNEK